MSSADAMKSLMKKQKGEITVFLALVLTIMISVLFTVIEAARNNAIQFQSECVADMALQSALAEYNRELLEQYELFFIETGYGTEEDGYILLEQHIQKYMEQNLTAGQSVFGGEIKDLLMLYPESVLISAASGAADDHGAVLERKAVDYMLYRYGMTELSKMLTETQKDTESTKQHGLLENGIEKKRQKNERAIDAVDTEVEDKDGKKKKIPINNPADKVNSRRGSSGILKLVTEGKTISDAAISKEAYISQRGYEDKDGFLQGEAAVTGMEDLIFQKYLMEKCGNYTDQKEDSLLSYQMEYILMGKSSDYENLKAVVNRLLMLRETANFMYIMSDSGKQAEAEALALTLAAVILFPELKDLIKLSILIAWSYAESVNDVRILLSGGNVPIWKDGSSWKLGLQNALKLQLDKGSTSTDKGLSYEAYLHILLAVMNKTDRNLRFMDVIEMDIRKKAGNEKFQIDHCIHSFNVELIIASAKGNSCLLQRTVGYQK